MINPIAVWWNHVREWWRSVILRAHIRSGKKHFGRELSIDTLDKDGALTTSISPGVQIRQRISIRAKVFRAKTNTVEDLGVIASTEMGNARIINGGGTDESR